MIIKNITFNNFKYFEGKHKFHFSKINVITGSIGSGKSTLIKDSILFGLHGYSESPLEKLPTKGKAKKCTLEIETDSCKIIRSYPTNIEIHQDEKLLFANNKIAQSWINETYQGLEEFRKFRLFDIRQGINILDEGKISLKKTLFSFHDYLFNKIRKNLLAKKQERSIWNKDNLQLSAKHYPSEKRLHQIEVRMLEISENLYKLNDDLRSLEEHHYSLLSKKGTYEGKKASFKQQKDNIVQYSKCPLCKRLINKNIKVKLLSEINSNFTELNKKISKLIEDVSDQKEIIEHYKTLKNKLQQKKEKLALWQFHLKNKLNYKHYKYTTEDIKIMEQAIRELDGFGSYYISEWIKILEPIINNIIIKIGLSIKFAIDISNNINVIFLKDNEQYSYKELSSGQKLIVSIALQLALLMEKGETGLVIADEGFAVLDSESLYMIIDLFSNLPFQLLAVAHRMNSYPDDINVINL